LEEGEEDGLLLIFSRISAIAILIEVIPVRNG
jgi:hypothetical protein